MESTEFLNFECPQYIDFKNELDASGKDDIFFDLDKGECAESRSLCTPGVQGKEKGLTDSDENKLLNKMTAALSVLENTPKIKKSASRGKLFPGTETVSKVKSAKGTKSTLKPHTVPAPRPKSRRSRSLEHLNRILSGKTNKKCGLHRSSSLNDLRTHNKLKYAVTPMCLKRTISKAKGKIVKTTEEIELEQIAKLQKELIQHLRQNEISLRKLNLRPKQGCVSKAQPKCDNSKNTRGAGVHAEKSNVFEKEQRRNIRMSNQAAAAIKSRAQKLNSVINRESTANSIIENTIYAGKCKALSVSSVDSDVNSSVLNQASVGKDTLKQHNTVTDEVASCKKSNTVYSRKTRVLSDSTTDSNVSNKNPIRKTKVQTQKRIMDHSGLIFIPSIKSNTTVKPFIFEDKMKTSTADTKQNETSASNLKENKDKENSGCGRPQSAKIFERNQNGKSENNKLAEPHKIIGKRIAKPVRGMPLAENVTRD